MAKRLQSRTIDFPFYSYLQNFIEQERKRVYSAFKPLTKKFLSFNNSKENSSAYLRKPQFEALEMYVFLKEFCENKKLWEVFEECIIAMEYSKAGDLQDGIFMAG